MQVQMITQLLKREVRPIMRESKILHRRQLEMKQRLKLT